VLHLNIPIQRREFSFDGARMSVITAGEPGSGVPILAIHGFGSSAQYTWQTTGHLIGLARAGRYVIAPDLLGHGLSAKPIEPGAYRIDRMVELATAALQTWAEPGSAYSGRADLLGYSLGARICWDALAGGRRWRRAVLGGYDGRHLFDGVDEPALRGALGDATGNHGGTAHGQPLSPETRRIIDIVTAVPGNSLPALLAMVEGLSGARPAAGSPTVPMLLAAGTDDPLASGAERLAAGLESAEFLPIPRRDHISAVPASVFRKGAIEFLAR